MSACRRARREAFYLRCARAVSAARAFLSAASAPFRAAGVFLLYFGAGCAARLGGLNRGGPLTLALSGAETLKKHTRINTALAFIAACVLIFAVSIYRVGLEVILDGESIGYVAGQSVVEDTLAAVSERAEEILGRAFTITPDITYRFSVVSKNKLFDAEGVEAGLLGNIPDIDRLCVLTIDGVAVSASWSPSDIQVVLNDILAGYPSTGQLTFYQNVSIQSKLAPLSLIREPEELARILSHTTGGGGAPMLSVRHVEQVSYSETVPFNTEYIEDPQLWLGESKTVTRGADGEALVVAQQTSVDGVHTETVVTGSLILTEPVTEVIATGTRQRSATGTFARPASGAMTSGWGWRTLRGARGFHYGNDFRGSRGDPIYAADGGVVSFVGWMNGYGMTVIIDHENGYKTLYAHCSRYRVVKGQQVGKGERIADIGNTGRSYGNHLHFEIQANGVAKNPAPYLN
jgi:murein DD-endopeptidase MepM/ murein hydrolase activator NlpD